MPVKRKEIAKRRNSQKEKAAPLEMGSGSTPGPLLKRVCRLSECEPSYAMAHTEIFTEDKLTALKNLILGQVRQLELENAPGSWAWRNPKNG